MTPRVIEDARFLAGGYDPGRVRAMLDAAGVADDDYAAQLHHTALKRTAARLALA